MSVAVVLMAASLGLSGCKCCGGPTIHTEVCADGHVLNEGATPGNSGPVHPMAVQNGDCCGPSVAMIDIDGILLDMDMTGPGSAGENPVSLFRERLDAAADDPCTRAVVVRINTYGGGVAACDVMRHDLEMFKNRYGVPVVAYMQGTGTGGGYYIATAADQIVATPTTITGGIGVILNLYNIEDFLQKNDVHPALIKAGENIDMGSPMHTASDDQRTMLESIANQYHERFREMVLHARPSMNRPQEEVFDGRIFTASQALQLHMIDQIGYIDDAMQAAANMGGLSNPRVVMYHRCNDRARSVYSMTPNVPMQGEAAPMNVPALSRSRMPTFLYMWEPEPSMEKLGGK
ncbi:MAG TPA: S49 family peptidase [Pirellulales bacterium]